MCLFVYIYIYNIANGNGVIYDHDQLPFDPKQNPFRQMNECEYASMVNKLSPLFMVRSQRLTKTKLLLLLLPILYYTIRKELWSLSFVVCLAYEESKCQWHTLSLSLSSLTIRCVWYTIGGWERPTTKASKKDGTFLVTLAIAVVFACYTRTNEFSV